MTFTLIPQHRGYTLWCSAQPMFGHLQCTSGAPRIPICTRTWEGQLTKQRIHYFPSLVFHFSFLFLFNNFSGKGSLRLETVLSNTKIFEKEKRTSEAFAELRILTRKWAKYSEKAEVLLCPTVSAAVKKRTMVFTKGKRKQNHSGAFLWLNHKTILRARRSPGTSPHAHTINVHQCIYLRAASITPRHKVDYKSTHDGRMNGEKQGKAGGRRGIIKSGKVRTHATDEAVWGIWFGVWNQKIHSNHWAIY